MKFIFQKLSSFVKQEINDLNFRAGGQHSDQPLPQRPLIVDQK
ncbi:MAG: hypothetical protein ACOWWM_06640 [Desulfobacterales bacterium]